MKGSIVALWCDDPGSTAALDLLTAALPSGVAALAPADRHVTLAMLPDVDLIPLDAREQLASELEQLAQSLGPVALAVTGVMQFADTDADGMAAVVALLDPVGPMALRNRITQILDSLGIALEGFPTYTPHITLGYGPAELLLDIADMPSPWACDRLGLALGPGRSFWVLTGAPKRARITGGTMARSLPAAAESAELKAAPHYTKSINGRTVVGIFSVTGNRDEYDDIIQYGAFAKTIRERGSKVLHLWQHDTDEPPIARVESLREIGANELPDQIRTQHPDATGGCEVTRTYLETPRANEVLANITASVPLQMSFMFDCVKWNTVEDAAAYWGYTRYIQEVRLYETSDVNWGANAATLASKRAKGLSLDLASIDRALTAYKAGSRHNAADVALINGIHKSIVDLGCTCCAGALEADTAGAKAATYAAGLLALLDQSDLKSDDPTLESLALRLVRTAVIIDSPVPTESESRAAAPAALTPERLAWYQQRAKAAGLLLPR